MIKNYIKIAWRNLIKNKAHSFINILGLSVGLACSLLIMLWIQNELAMDNFHKNGKQLYYVIERSYYDHKAHGQYNTPGMLADELKKDIPEIEYASNLAFDNSNTFQVGDKIIKLQGNSAGADYFKMFSFPLLQGDAKIVLSTPKSIAISRKMAGQFFGSPEAAMGKTIRYENQKDFVVTGVFEDIPNTSTEKFDFMLNWYNFLDENAWCKQWGNNGPECFFMLRPDANPAAVQKKLTHFLDNLNKEQKKGVFTVELDMQKFGEGYLHGNFTEGKIDGGRIEYVRLFGIVAIFILLIACINFMNLTTARSVKRAREIGVRKVVGALRGSLIKQFIGESLMLTIVAVLISLLLVILLLPLFNSVTMKQIELPFAQLNFWLKLVVITLVTGLIAGSYPALFLSSFSPIKVLKGTLKLNWGVVMFRKGLVIFQFVLSIVLILGTIVISRQINYIQSKNLGFDRENLVFIPIDGELPKKFDVFKTEAMKMPGIQNVSRMGDRPMNIQNGTSGVDWIGKDPNLNIQFTQASIGYDFMRTMKLKMAAGRDYNKDFATDSAGYILNEAALKRIAYKDPIGKPLTFWGKKGTIIGIVKDFHYTSLHDPIKPLVIRLMKKPIGALSSSVPKQAKPNRLWRALKHFADSLTPTLTLIIVFLTRNIKSFIKTSKLSGSFLTHLLFWPSLYRALAC